MSQLETISALIVKHIGTSDFGLGGTLAECGYPHFWSGMILRASERQSLTFGIAQDAIKLEDFHRLTKQLVANIDELSIGTRSYTPKSRGYRGPIRPLPHPEADVFQDARSALCALEEWISEMRREHPFKTQAGMGRNWRAASVAAECRHVWGYGQFHVSGRDDTLQAALSKLPRGTSAGRALVEEKSAFVFNCAPRSEKHDSPGPFGRFLEEVLEVLDIHGRNGSRVSAHSALRALSQAVSKNAKDR